MSQGHCPVAVHISYCNFPEPGHREGEDSVNVKTSGICHRTAVSGETANGGRDEDKTGTDWGENTEPPGWKGRGRNEVWWIFWGDMM